MGEDVEPLVDHAGTKDVLNCEYVEYPVEEYVVRQVIETITRTKPGSAEGSWPGETESC